MSNGWFALTTVAAIVIASGFVIAAVIARAAWAQREREALTATDLRAVEESAVVLIEQLKSEADQSVAELDKRCVELRELLLEADERLAALRPSGPAAVGDYAPPPLVCAEDTPDADRRTILNLARTGLGSAEIAKATGRSCAEVNLVLSLSNSRKTDTSGIVTVQK